MTRYAMNPELAVTPFARLRELVLKGDVIGLTVLKDGQQVDIHGTGKFDGNDIKLTVTHEDYQLLDRPHGEMRLTSLEDGATQIVEAPAATI